MGRPANIIRPRKLTINLPEDKMQMLDRFLWSDRTNCVPVGSYSRFFTERIEEYMAKLAASGNAILAEVENEH